MATSIADERRLLTAEEYRPIARSHHPELAGLDAAELRELVGWLREQRARCRTELHHRRRVRRGKAEPRNAAAEQSSERGVAAKKQVFARALKRVNGRLETLRAGARQAEIKARLVEALARRRAATIHHPQTGAHGNPGMQPIESGRGADVLDPAAVGRTSQAVRQAQAVRDNRGG